MTYEEKFCEIVWKQIADKGVETHTAGLEEAAKLLPIGGKLLDVGCGRGEFVSMVREEFDEIHGTDISETALGLIAKLGIKTHKVNLNLEPLPFEDDYFDAMTCFDFIEHVYEPLDLVKEMARVLKPNGIVVIQTFNIRYYKHIWSITRGHFPLTVGEAPENLDIESYNYQHYSNFTFADLEGVLNKYGIEVTARIGTGQRKAKTALDKLLKFALPEWYKREFLSPGLMVAARKSGKT